MTLHVSRGTSDVAISPANDSQPIVRSAMYIHELRHPFLYGE